MIECKWIFNRKHAGVASSFLCGLTLTHCVGPKVDSGDPISDMVVPIYTNTKVTGWQGGRRGGEEEGRGVQSGADEMG